MLMKNKSNMPKGKLGKHSLRLKPKGGADRIIPKKKQFT